MIVCFLETYCSGENPDRDGCSFWRWRFIRFALFCWEGTRWIAAEPQEKVAWAIPNPLRHRPMRDETGLDLGCHCAQKASISEEIVAFFYPKVMKSAISKWPFIDGQAWKKSSAIALFQLFFDLFCFTEIINNASYPENKSDTYFYQYIYGACSESCSIGYSAGNDERNQYRNNADKQLQ